MIRTPLRPLARVIDARKQGHNPDHIEASERAKRNQALQQKLRKRAEGRLIILGLAFLLGFGAIGGKMAMLAVSAPEEPKLSVSSSKIYSQRADIIDRNGYVLATNLITTSLYAQPQMMVNPARAAEGLKKIFPDIELDKLTRKFSGKRTFVWVRKKISPEQQQAVQDIGDPGLFFGPREMRLYPNGTLAAHILGGASFGKEGVQAAELIGVAGIEKFFDDRLRDPAQVDKPLQLSIDLTAQATTRRVLEGGMKIMNAKSAAAIVLDVKTGEIISMVSLPDFDPNKRPKPLLEGDPTQSPLFNRAAQGVFELGSTFKAFTAALSIEKGLASENTMINIKGPIKIGGFKIKDFKDYGNQMSVSDIIVKSSNIGSARLAQAAGAEVQKAFLKDLGFFDPMSVELTESVHVKTLYPKDWTELSTMTISYGHGIAVTPLHLASAYATLANGGYKIRPTLLKGTGQPAFGERILSGETSVTMMRILRGVVTRGTASFGDVKGYSVGGKTGTADKPNPTGGYYEGKVISTFASVFPTNDPKYVLILMLDEPTIEAAGQMRRTAGWTAVPVAAELITRLAPILNMRPQVAAIEKVQYTQAQN